MIQYCTINESILQGKKYQELHREITFWSACYSNDYLIQHYLSDIDMPSDGKMLFFDIGANKGYTIASWISLWMPYLGINTRSLGNYLRTKLNLDDCGACSDCKEDKIEILNLTSRVNKTIEIYAFEPQPPTYKLLNHVHQWMNISFLHLYDLAISNETGTGLLMKCHPGGEACGLNAKSDKKNLSTHIQANLITLDKFIEDHKIYRKIDLLKVDTEGFDPLVIQGANTLLTRHQIRLFIFEYHTVGMWSKTSLQYVITYLDNKGYLCYQIGKTGIFRLTGCWSTFFETRFWSNVLCISRRESRLIKFIEMLLIKV
ncbi:unnamed protein product [Adineta steineri]|nr:unnamed protein product [Adineta steineri]